MARTKVTAKREPDIFQRTFMGLFEQLSGAGVTVTAALVGLLLVMALLWGFSSSREKANAEAWKKLTAALEEPDLDRRIKKLEQELNATSKEAEQAAARMLVEARCFERDNPTEAKSIITAKYKAVFEKYPRTKAAKEARKRCEELSE